MTEEQKQLAAGKSADPDDFGRDTGDASLDDSRNADEIGKKELLVVSFGTSFNGSRAQDIRGIEDALQADFPDWSVRRAFSSQIIINHIQARENQTIDNVKQAMERASANGVETLVIQPTHLMHGTEYDALMDTVEAYRGRIANIAVAEPLLGPVGQNATVVNQDKQDVCRILTAAAVEDSEYDTLAAAAADGAALVFMGHGTSHTARVSYNQMQHQMDQLGFRNVFIGTVEGRPEETSCEALIETVKDAGFRKIILRPLMVVAGDHAENDMAGLKEDSWLSMFQASGYYEAVTAQIAGLGRIPEIQELYAAHTRAAMDAAQ